MSWLRGAGFKRSRWLAIGLLVGGSLLLVVAVGLWRATPSEEFAATPEVGEALYAVKRCSTCHAINGVGGQSGCDLSRVARRRKKEWMARWLEDPQRVRPGTNMPNMGLHKAEARAIAAYLATRR